MSNVSEEQIQKYKAILAEKRKEFGLDKRDKENLQPIAAILASEPAQGEQPLIARSDVFGPVILNGSNSKWDTFDTSVHADAAKIKTLVGDWLKRGMPAGKSLLIEGNCGTGKTHLAQAIAEAYPYVRSSMNDNGARLINEVELIERYKATWGGAVSHTEIIDDLLSPQILIFDDLGAYQTRSEDWLANIYYQIFDGRCEQGKACLFLSNMSLDRDRGFGCLRDRIGDRNYDRLVGAIMIRDHPEPGKPLGNAIGKWLGELYIESVRTGNLYTKLVGVVKSALIRPGFNS